MRLPLELTENVEIGDFYSIDYYYLPFFLPNLSIESYKRNIFVRH